MFYFKMITHTQHTHTHTTHTHTQPTHTCTQVLVKPECGRLVGFSAGKENMHGVKGVTGGRRCAVALWFTLDQRYDEAAFHEAETILSSI